jgi:hypothetical protein
MSARPHCGIKTRFLKWYAEVVSNLHWFFSMRGNSRALHIIHQFSGKKSNNPKTWKLCPPQYVLSRHTLSKQTASKTPHAEKVSKQTISLGYHRKAKSNRTWPEVGGQDTNGFEQ